MKLGSEEVAVKYCPTRRFVLVKLNGTEIVVEKEVGVGVEIKKGEWVAYDKNDGSVVANVAHNMKHLVFGVAESDVYERDL